MRSDNPIENAEDDVLGRDVVAARLVDQVLRLDSSEGLVIGVLGAWGTGKTSLINLTRPVFTARDAVVLDYNPWMFSGADQLVSSFFSELAAELKVRSGRLSAIGQSIGEYGEALSGLGWLPVLGPWIERGRGLAKLFAAASKGRAEGIGRQRARLTETLTKLEHPIVVIVDDIDRLSTSEIRDVFKLVRLTASFPNIIYIVSFDRQRVEKALSDEAIDGRDYLEKILQVAIDLPSASAESLRLETLRSLQEATEGIEWFDSADEEAWPDAYGDIIAPLIRHMRDVRRYALAASAAVRYFNGRIALSDVLALEAVRTFLPEVFALLPGAASALTETSEGSDRSKSLNKDRVESLVEAAGENNEVARGMVRRLFPASARHIENNHYGPEWRRIWRQHRRVAHLDFLRLYLEHIEGTSLTTHNRAASALSVMHDAVSFRALLSALPPADRLEVLAGLNDLSDSFESVHVQSAVPYLLDSLPDLPSVRPGAFSLPSSHIIDALVMRLLSTIQDPALALGAIEAMLPSLRSYSSRFRLLSLSNRESRDGARILDEADAARLIAEWRSAVRATAPGDLAAEPEVLTVMWAASRGADGEVAWAVPDNLDLICATFTSATRTATWHGLSTRTVKMTREVSLDQLTSVFGTQEEIARRLGLVRDRLFAEDAELVALLDRRLAGDQDDLDDF